MADIGTMKQLVQLCRRAEITLFIWGLHGIGKSSLVAQTAEALGIEMIDLRCAQLDAVDLRGFPDKGSDGRTHFLPPADFPSDGQGILLLDELNRANPEVLSAAFQLVLDRRIGEYILPSGWSIVCAGNFDGGDYAVNELDPAFADRFCHAVLDAGLTTFGEWSDWMLAQYGDAAYTAVNFCATNLRHLEDVERQETRLKVEPSRRSWDAVVRGLQCFTEEFSDECRREFVAGLIGPDLATSFLAHQPTLKPNDIVQLGVSKVRPKLNRCERSELTVMMNGLVALLGQHAETERVLETILDFANFLLKDHADLAIALCNAVMMRDSSLANAQGATALLANTRLGTAVAELQDSLGDRGLLAKLAERSELRNRLAEVLGGA